MEVLKEHKTSFLNIWVFMQILYFYIEKKTGWKLQTQQKNKQTSKYHKKVFMLGGSGKVGVS